MELCIHPAHLFYKLSLHGRLSFSRAKLLRPGATSSDAALAVGVFAGSLPQPKLGTKLKFQFFMLKIGYSGFTTQTAHLSNAPSGHSYNLHVKRPALPKKLKRASQKGKN